MRKVPDTTKPRSSYHGGTRAGAGEVDGQEDVWDDDQVSVDGDHEDEWDDGQADSRNHEEN